MSRALVPWWGVLGLVGLALFGTYFVFLYWLTGGADVAANGVGALLNRDKLALERKVPDAPAPPPVIPPPEPDRITQMQRICNALAPEVIAQKVNVEQTANQITVRIGNLLLFNSGVATVLDQFKPIGERIAATLEKEDGYIKVDRPHRQQPDRRRSRALSLQLCSCPSSAPRMSPRCSGRC